MKKNLFMVAAVALMAMVSCNKEEIGNSGVQAGAASDIVFSAELEQPGAPAAEQTPAEAQTKTSLGTTTGDVTSVNWVAGDKVKINGVEFSATESGTRTDFTTTASFTEAETYYAVYPATAAGAADLSKVTIPASQKGTFAEAAISVAKSNTQSLHFKNVASIVKFQVPSACSEVTIESTADLAGTFNVTFNGETPSVGSVSNGSKKITLLGSFAPGTDYYVAVLPGSHIFTIRIGGYLSNASAKAVTTTRSKIANLQTLPALVECEWGMVGQHQNWILAKANLTRLYKEADNLFVVKGIKLSSTGFKFTQLTNTNWDLTFGVHSGDYVYSPLGSWYQGIYTNNRGDKSNDIKVSDWNKTYDIYLRYVQNANWGKELGFAIVETGTACPSF